jgi:hypothetical protein
MQQHKVSDLTKISGPVELIDYSFSSRTRAPVEEQLHGVFDSTNLHKTI